MSGNQQNTPRETRSSGNTVGTSSGSAVGISSGSGSTVGTSSGSGNTVGTSSCTRQPTLNDVMTTIAEYEGWYLKLMVKFIIYILTSLMIFYYSWRSFVEKTHKRYCLLVGRALPARFYSRGSGIYYFAEGNLSTIYSAM